MSEEIKIRKRKKYPPVVVTCSICNKQFKVAYSTFNECKRENRPFRCSDCTKKFRSDFMVKRNAERSKEEKDKQKLLSSIVNKARWQKKKEEKIINEHIIEKPKIIPKPLLAHRKVEVNTINPEVRKNKFHQRFERQFSESHLANDFYLKPLITTENNGNKHTWDYGVYSLKTKELQMVVDLDDALHHADNCDYDGIYADIEKDMYRGLSVPEGIKIGIMLETKFQLSLELIIKQLFVNYEQYVQTMFNWMRSIDFPYPKYTKLELLESWDQLLRMKCNDRHHEDISLNTRVGDRLIQHFHPSIWHDHRDGEISPHEAWQDDNLIYKVIRNRIIYQNYINPSKVIQGFNIMKIATKVSVYSAGRAKMVINRYLGEFSTIFDPFSGYSGRLLGAISLGKKYIGQDINKTHVEESNNLLKFLYENTNSDIQATIKQKDILESNGEYECLFTCSPYSNKEIWEGSPISYNSCDEWIDVCLDRFKCKRYVFTVDETYKYQDHVVAQFGNKSHFSNAQEYLIVI